MIDAAGNRMKELKKKLKEIIKNSPELNQQIVSKRVGISQPYLNEILNNNKTGSFELLNKIADSVGVSIKTLLTEDDQQDGKIIVENEEEKKLLAYFRELDTKKRFMLLSLASDYHKYCTLVRKGIIKRDE